MKKEPAIDKDYKVYTSQEVCLMLKINLSELKSYIENGDIKCLSLPGKRAMQRCTLSRTRFTESQIEQFIKENTVE